MFVCCLPTQTFQAGSVDRKIFFSHFFRKIHYFVFRYLDSKIPLLPIFKISSLLPSSVLVQPSLYWTWSETQKTILLAMRLISDTYLLPASSPCTVFPSTTVNEPIPGRIRFFRISVPVAVALMRHTFAASSAD